MMWRCQRRLRRIETGDLELDHVSQWYSLRHSLATFLIARGNEVKTVKNILRHVNRMNTRQIYAHVRNKDRSEAQG